MPHTVKCFRQVAQNHTTIFSFIYHFDYIIIHFNSLVHTGGRVLCVVRALFLARFRILVLKAESNHGLSFGRMVTVFVAIDCLTKFKKKK